MFRCPAHYASDRTFKEKKWKLSPHHHHHHYITINKKTKQKKNPSLLSSTKASTFHTPLLCLFLLTHQWHPTNLLKKREQQRRKNPCLSSSMSLSQHHLRQLPHLPPQLLLLLFLSVVPGVIVSMHQALAFALQLPLAREGNLHNSASMSHCEWIWSLKVFLCLCIWKSSQSCHILTQRVEYYHNMFLFKISLLSLIMSMRTGWAKCVNVLSRIVNTTDDLKVCAMYRKCVCVCVCVCVCMVRERDVCRYI